MDADRITGLLEYKRSNQHGREVFALVWSSILAYYWIDSVWLAAMFTAALVACIIIDILSDAFTRGEIENEIKKELGLVK